MSQDVHNQADWLAGEGYLAVAPDLYYWGRKITCIISFLREVTLLGPAAPLQWARSGKLRSFHLRVG